MALRMGTSIMPAAVVAVNLALWHSCHPEVVEVVRQERWMIFPALLSAIGWPFSQHTIWHLCPPNHDHVLLLRWQIGWQISASLSLLCHIYLGLKMDGLEKMDEAETSDGEFVRLGDNIPVQVFTYYTDFTSNKEIGCYKNKRKFNSSFCTVIPKLFQDDITFHGLNMYGDGCKSFNLQLQLQHRHNSSKNGCFHLLLRWQRRVCQCCLEDKRVFRPFLARAHLIYRQHYVHLLQQYCSAEPESRYPHDI